MARPFPSPLKAGLYRCPAHDDRAPSLSIRQADDGRWLLFCHAGCATDQVLARAGLTFDDLWPDHARRPRALPPPAEQRDIAALIAEALRLDRAHGRRRDSATCALVDDLIRVKRRVAHHAREWAARWGECPASWKVLALAAELDREAEDLASARGADA